MKTALGLMSGTSCDGVDASILKTDGHKIAQFGPTLFLPYSDDFRKRLKAATLEKAPNKDIEDELTECHIHASLALIKDHPVDIIGFHGQTIWHDSKQKISIQIGNAGILSKACRTPVVFNFRANDLQNGGCGAPLIPIFHKALSQKNEMFINIGGVSNFTYIGAELIAGDIGPGNALIDDWIFQKTGLFFDKDGSLAEQGRIHMDIAEKLFADPFFEGPFPKSLDRNHFSYILKDMQDLAVEDGAATLAYITNTCIKKIIDIFRPSKIYVHGGGAHNPSIMQGLDVCALDTALSDFMESYAFAFLAVRCLKGLPISFPLTTGVRKAVSGGSFY